MTAGDLLSVGEIAELARVSSLRGTLLVAHAWAVIAAAAALCALWPSPATVAIAVAVIGARQMGLAVLMHEAAHWRLFAGARANNLVGDWLCGAPIGADLRQYRPRHHLHHRHTQRPEDPDLALSAGLPLGRGRLALAFLADLLGITAAGRLARWRPWRGGPAEAWSRVRAPLAANAILFAACTLAASPALYLLAWVLPWATWYQALTRLRDIAEHGMVGDAGDALRNTRTVRVGAIARALLAPYWVHHHLEHHLCVFVPCWKLPRVRERLLAGGLETRMEMAPGYAWVLARAAGSR